MKTFITKQIKKPFFGRFMVRWQNPLVNDFLWRKNSVKSQSGGKIVYWYLEQPEAKATILLGHPMGKPAKGEFLKTEYPTALAQAGYNVCVFDFNGFGESSMGDFNYHHDLLSVRDEMKNIFPDIPMAFHGISFGGNWGTIALTVEDNPFKVAILESSCVNLPEFWIHYPTASKVLTWLYAVRPDYMEYADFEKAITKTKNCEEIMIISANEDKYTPYEMAIRLQNSANTYTEIIRFENAMHAKSQESNPKRYLETCIGFFEQRFQNTQTDKKEPEAVFF